MSITSLQEQAWQSGLVLLDETGEWNETDWPPLEGDGWRSYHASVVLNHADQDNTRGQTVVLLGGYHQDGRVTNSVLVLNFTESNKKWREGTPMNKTRVGHAAVVCNGDVYVMGGYNGFYLDCIERIDVNDLLQSSSTESSTHESNWTTLNCRLSTARSACSAVAVHNRYIVVMGGWNWRQHCLSSVDIVDTRNHTVIAGPSLNHPRQVFASAVIGHRIFVVGGCRTNTSVEYLEFTKPCDNEERNDDTLSTVISFSSAWRIHSDLVLSEPRTVCAAVAVGSCLVVVGAFGRTELVLDTHRNRVWNLPKFRDRRRPDNMVALADQIVGIVGGKITDSGTLPLMDKTTWCFRKLCDKPLNGWYHFLGRIREGSSNPTLTVASESATANIRHGDENGGKKDHS